MCVILAPFLCPRQMWDISLRLGNADSDGWQRRIQLQLERNKQPFKMTLRVGRWREKPVLLYWWFPLLNERKSRQVIPKAVGSQDDSDISSLWERKQIGIIKIRHTPYKSIYYFLPDFHCIHMCNSSWVERGDSAVQNTRQPYAFTHFCALIVGLHSAFICSAEGEPVMSYGVARGAAGAQFGLHVAVAVLFETLTPSTEGRLPYWAQITADLVVS